MAGRDYYSSLNEIHKLLFKLHTVHVSGQLHLSGAVALDCNTLQAGYSPLDANALH